MRLVMTSHFLCNTHTLAINLGPILPTPATRLFLKNQAVQHHPPNLVFYYWLADHEIVLQLQTLSKIVYIDKLEDEVILEFVAVVMM